MCVELRQHQDSKHCPACLFEQTWASLGGLFGFFPPEKPLSPKKGQPARSTVTLENGALRLDLAITILLIFNKKWQFRHTY